MTIRLAAGREKQEPTREDLGEALFTCKVRPGWKVFSLFGLLGISVPLAYGAWRSIYGFYRYGSAAILAWGLPWFLLTGIVVILFLLLLLGYWLQSNHFFSIHRKGLRYANSPRTIKSLRWEEINGISTTHTRSTFFGIHERTHLVAVIFPKVGAPLRIPTDLDNQVEFVTRLKAIYYPRILPDIGKAFEAGHWVYFGKLEVHQLGFRVINRNGRRTETIYWNQLDEANIRSGYLELSLSGRPEGGGTKPAPIRIVTTQVPNLELFVQLLNEKVRV